MKGSLRSGPGVISSRAMRSALIPLGLVLLVAIACGGGEPADPELLRLGRLVYREEGCGARHGADLRGATMGPSLERLSRHWETEPLERFLVAPDEAIAASSRLQRLDAAYPANMPGVFDRDSERLRALVAYLLER